MRTPRLLRSALLLVVAVAAGSGCSTILQKLHGNKAATERAAELQILQFRVMRFADQYVGGISEPIQQFQMSTGNAQDRLLAQEWKLSESTAAYTIASGPSPVVNALDMIVLATLSRMVVDDEWITVRFGARATPLREAHERLEAQARELGKNVISPDQFAQLQRVIDEWREKNPHINAVSYVHFSDFAASIGHPMATERSAGGLFQLLGIDPLSNLDPAVREIAQSRELAERTIYYAQRLPNLVDMQVERMADQFATTPETIRLLANADSAARAAQATGQLAGELPGLLTREREAAIRQMMDALSVQSARVQALSKELRATLEAGNATSASLTTTIRAFDQLMERFQPATNAGDAAKSSGRPFDITEYTAAAAEITRAADQLDRLIGGVAGATPALAVSAEHAAASFKSVVDHAYWRGVELIGLLLVGGLATALVYRGLAPRLQRRPPPAS